MSLPGILVATLGCVCVLDLAGAAPRTASISDDFQHLVSSIKGLAVTIADQGSESTQTISDAIRSQQTTLQQLLSAVLNQTNSRCQPSEVEPPDLNETKHTNSVVEEKFEEIMETMGKLTRKIEGIDDLLRALDDRIQNPRNCSLPYKKLGTDCVYISQPEEKLSWLDARSFCWSQGGDLVMSTIVTLLPYVLRSETSQVFWMGGSDLETEGDFRWLSGDKVDSGWYASQPDKSAEDCLAYAVDSPGLHDYSCESERRFICSRG